mgnify:CR=1 FL=1
MKNLPTAATVIFGLEEIDRGMTASNKPRFTITAKHESIVVKLYNLSATAVNQRVVDYSSQTLLVVYSAKNMSFHGEHVRIKYTGR